VVGVGGVGDVVGVVGVGVWGCVGVWVWGCGAVWVCGCGGVGVVSPCVRTFQGLHSVRLWTPTILYHFLMGDIIVI
jgi:hypothetical protein